MHDLKHECRLPGDGDSSMISGSEPGTAIRIRRLPAQGLVILEQMRHSRSAGWYVQRSLPVPECMLEPVIRELRKADCMTPRPHRPSVPAATTHLRLRLD